MRPIAIVMAAAVAGIVSTAWCQERPSGVATSPVDAPPAAPPPANPLQPTTPPPIIVVIPVTTPPAPALDGRAPNEHDERRPPEPPPTRADAARKSQRLALDVGAAFETVPGISLGMHRNVMAAAAIVGGEVRVAGPLWFVTRLDAGYATLPIALDAHDWTIGAGVGLRLAFLVASWLDLGGHLLAHGEHDTAEVKGGPTLAGNSIGVTTGADFHVRPTRAFGLRAGLELGSIGYATASWAGAVYDDIFGGFQAMPSLEATVAF